MTISGSFVETDGIVRKATKNRPETNALPLKSDLWICLAVLNVVADALPPLVIFAGKVAISLRSKLISS